MQEAKRSGRPSSYTKEMAEEICDAIACNGQGLKRLCKEHDHWPCPDTIYRWLKANKDFSDSYARAKQYQIEVIVDDILEIADDSSNDYLTNDDGKLVVNHEHIQRARLKIDTRKWLAAKLCPKLYGDKPANEASDFNLEEINRDRELAHRCMKS